MSLQPRAVRPIAIAVGCAISAIGAWLALSSTSITDTGAGLGRAGALWAGVQFLTGTWSGALGAGSPLLHGLICGVPALLLGLATQNSLPAHFHAVIYLLAPVAALLAAAALRYGSRGAPS